MSSTGTADTSLAVLPFRRSNNVVVGCCEFTVSFFIYRSTVHSVHLQVFLVFGPCVHAVCNWMLVRLAQPYLGSSGELLEAGADLSDNYIAEYVLVD